MTTDRFSRRITQKPLATEKRRESDIVKEIKEKYKWTETVQITSFEELLWTR